MNCNYFIFFIGTLKSPLELSVEEWNQVVGTNLKGSWLVSKYVCMHMRETKRSGSIINISSIAGLNRGELPGGLAYASSKAGLNTLTKVMFLVLSSLYSLDILRECLARCRFLRLVSHLCCATCVWLML